MDGPAFDRAQEDSQHPGMEKLVSCFGVHVQMSPRISGRPGHGLGDLRAQTTVPRSHVELYPRDHTDFSSATREPKHYPWFKKASAVRNESAMIVKAGFAAMALGNAELSHIHRLQMSKLLP